MENINVEEDDKTHNSLNKISVSTSDNKINRLNPNINTNKLSRYIFPRINPPDDPEWYKDDRKSTEKMMDVICNSLGLLSNRYGAVSKNWYR